MSIYRLTNGVLRIFEKVSNKLYAVAYQQQETIFEFDEELNQQLSEKDELERNFMLLVERAVAS